MEEIDIAIIGAGVVGLAIGAELAQAGKEVYIFERNETFGQETSSRNSEVVHAGIYYPPGTLKAKTCVEGNALIYEICERYGIPYKKRGKLVVAISQDEMGELEELLERGKENGARNLKLISKSELKKLEPYVDGEGAIHSPTSGVIDSHSLMRYFAGVVKSNKGWIVYKANVVGIDKTSNGYKVMIVEDNKEHSSFRTRILINCAGLQSDKIAELVGIDIEEASYSLKFCKGDYFSVGNGKSNLLSHLVYPVPESDSTVVGIHSTLDIQGRFRLGPDDYYIPEDKLDYTVDESKKEIFYNSAKRFLPFLELDDLEPEMSGIRPKLQGPDESYRDFVIQDEKEKGFPGFINLIGIESPGLTSAPAIAKYVNGLID
ncbi:NAD(P)/FAD-dependent oxidoreductase [candidate division WOR-3 bacterium]|nr:NAD(P)/FAD-dependent oxidoreductase [candidate division WOR-3 bacterium]